MWSFFLLQPYMDFFLSLDHLIFKYCLSWKLLDLQSSWLMFFKSIQFVRGKEILLLVPTILLLFALGDVGNRSRNISGPCSSIYRVGIVITDFHKCWRSNPDLDSAVSRSNIYTFICLRPYHSIAPSNIIGSFMSSAR